MSADLIAEARERSERIEREKPAPGSYVHEDADLFNRLAARLAEAERVIEPFARALDDELFQPVEMEGFPPCNYADDQTVHGVCDLGCDSEAQSDDYLFTVGDLRAARAWRDGVTPAPEKKEENDER